jgi:hypothetical protein
MTQEQDALLQRAGYFDIVPTLSCSEEFIDDNPIEHDDILEDFIEDDEDEDEDEDDEDFFADDDEDETIG